jgi:hypothetical protein
MKRNTVRWAKKQWRITEALILEARAHARMAASMERALLGPLRVTVRPVDDRGSEHYEDEEPADMTMLEDKILLRYVNMCVVDTYTVTAANVYARGEFILQVPLQSPLYVMRAAVLSLGLTIDAHDQASRMLVRLMFQ